MLDEAKRAIIDTIRFGTDLKIMIYQIKEAIIGFPGCVLLDRVSMEIRNTEKICIVGRNGCGKTTLLKVIAGRHETSNLDSDEVFGILKSKSLRIGYLEQMSFSDESKTVREELMNANPDLSALRRKLATLTETLEHDTSTQVITEYTNATERFEAMGGYSYTSEMEQMFTRFGFAIQDMERTLNTFSGGQKTKIAFAKLLLSKPDVCLLDEPTNHLDLPTIEWLEGYLKSYKHAVVIVSHDRMFLDRIADVTYEIEYRQMKRYVGNYTDFMRQKQLDYEKQCRDYEAQQKEIERLTLFIEKWKNTPTKVAMTRSKKMQIEHMVKIPKPIHFDTKPMHNKFQPAVKSGSEVLQVKKIKLGYTEELAEVSFELRRGQHLAVLGENGRGKSTLLKTIVGQISAYNQADGDGRIVFGKDVDWAYFDQELLNLDEHKTVIEELWDAYPRLEQTEIRTILGNFLFSGEEVYKPVKQLSGGERVRLSLAKLMRKQANLLILDEPTNHLDMIGKEALESILKTYQGTVLFVSHDRYFVKSIANCLLIFENGKVDFYPDDYVTYLEKCEEKQKQAQEQSFTDDRKVQAGPKKATSAVQLDREAQKEQQRRKQRLARIEDEIAKQEEVVAKWKARFEDPEIAADYAELDEVHKRIVEEEEKLNTLYLEWSGLV